MGKTFLYRLVKRGAIPVSLRKVLEPEGILVFDEGIGEWYATHVSKSPGRRFKRRRAGFSGVLVVTKRRIVAYT